MRYSILLLTPTLLLTPAPWAVGQPPPVEPPPVGVRRVVTPRTGTTAAPAKPAAPSRAEIAATAVSAVGLLGSNPGCGPLLAVSSVQARSRRAPAAESPRLTRFKQLQFDRRPSAILKAWAHRPDPKTAAPKTPARSPLDVELATFQRQVTLGDWPAVKAYLAKLPAAEGKAVYKHLLQSLQGSTATRGIITGRIIQGPDGSQITPQKPESNAFTAGDIMGLAAAAPGRLEADDITKLGALLRHALDGHTVAPDVVKQFQAEVDKKTGRPALTTRQAAQVLMAADEPLAAGNFLPSLDQAKADKDSEGLNLLVRHFLGVYEKEKKAIFLERAWSAIQAVLALTTAKVDEKEEALRRAVEVAPKIKEELGQAWLEQSFTSQPERGMEILAAIGGLASQGMDTKPTMRDERLKVLQLQKTAIEALLKAAPQLAVQWHDTLGLLAAAWMREAEYTKRMDSTSTDGYRVVRRGRVTSYRWYGDPDQMLRQQNLPLPIHTADILRTRPAKDWMDKLDAGTRAKLCAVLAHLYLKAEDEKSAFPLIEELAPINKEAARELVNEFLSTWTAGHDPNAARGNNDSMFYMGYYPSSRGTADSIPLTRSKQARNLEELAGWVDRLRRLPVDRLDEELLIAAFTKCHSSAEVYRLEDIEKIFGPTAKIKPRTLANLIQTTRANLAGAWREPAEQQKQKTNRKQKDIEVEVLRGYTLAGSVVADALKQFPDDWSLHLARAALLHDEINFRQEVARNADFSKKRDEAIANFQKAATLYADQVKKLSEDEETVAVYQQWFNVSLGACELDQVTEDKLPDPRQAPLIRKALSALPGEAAERHRNKMAEALVANLAAVNPAVRHRYLKLGFEIVGDNSKAAKARQVFDYYKDLVQEIKLDAVIDGSDRVGHAQPFGLFVNIRHTREIEREAGGFGRYLQNQNSGHYYYYNFGRPNADYRDRFEAAAREALKDKFEILSITFQSDKVHSRALSEYGWRVTPYAYLLLKPRGPQVDKVPPLRLDLDFQDNTTDFSDIRRAAGYVILPVESPAVPIDATPAQGESRPLRKLQITQILDERRADQGKLGLEIKATGVGLVGTLEETLALAPEGFDVTEVKDQGVSVAKFDEEGEANAVVSERTWLVDLRAKADHAAAAPTFHFAAAKVAGADMTYQRYQDADLANAAEEVTLEHTYEGRGRAWLWVVGISGAALGVILLAVLTLVLRRRPRAAADVPLPDKLTPFTVTVLLRRIRQTDGLSTTDREAVDRAIADVERHYFAESDGNGAIDLRTLAEDWVRRVK